MSEDLVVRAPRDGRELLRLPETSAVEVERETRHAAAVFDSGVWSGLPPRERAAVLLRLADLMAADAETLAVLDSQDGGKPITECRTGDVPGAIESIRWFAEAIDKRTDQVLTTPADVLAWTQREPYGVVAAILPWNYPLAMTAWKVGPALAAGNCLILKPADNTPRSALRLVELAAEAGLPAGVLRVLPGSGTVTGAALAADPRIGALSFTGSTATGRRILHAAADSNLKRVSLEMGGKSPQLLLEDALAYPDLINSMIVSSFLTSGQNCTAGSRILVHRSISDEVKARFVAAAEQLRTGDPDDPTTDLGPVLNDLAADRILAAVGAAVDAGASVATGGAELEVIAGGRYLPPTVLVDVPATAPILSTELFGPVVTIQSFETIDEAVALANGTDYGLAASLWTTKVDRAIGLARRLRAGLVSVNCYSEGDLTLPFGGWGQSGFGSPEKSLKAFEQWTREKAVWVQLH